MARITAVEILRVPVSPKTSLLFLRLCGSDGLVGLGI
jgi:hypothetical protein